MVGVDASPRYYSFRFTIDRRSTGLEYLQSLFNVPIYDTLIFQLAKAYGLGTLPSATIYAKEKCLVPVGRVLGRKCNTSRRLRLQSYRESSIYTHGSHISCRLPQVLLRPSGFDLIART